MPLWWVKSPPCNIKFGMTLWKNDPLYPNPFYPVHKALKLSIVLGTSEKSSNSILPVPVSPIWTSKKTEFDIYFQLKDMFIIQKYFKLDKY